MLGTYCEHAVHILCMLAGLPSLAATNTLNDQYTNTMKLARSGHLQPFLLCDVMAQAIPSLTQTPTKDPRPH